jgi:ribosomal-protein-serine acetyltransferase
MLLNVNKHTHLEIIQTAHAEAMFHLIDNNRSYLREWLLFIDDTQNIQDVEDYARDAYELYVAKKEYTFAIFYDGAMVGRITLNNINQRNKTGELAYWIAANQQGKGIVQSSCSTLIDYAFNTLLLNRIEIKVDTQNTRSIAIPLKLHFTQEGILRQAKKMRSHFADITLFSLLRHEWNRTN